jgi:membrane peptidoglycan carboxypeptidase
LFAIPGKRAVSQETAFLISHILQDNNARLQAFGGGSLLIIPRQSVSVKTGTTDDKKDNWTIGYTPNFLTAVWVGNNDNTPMNPALASGVTGAAPIWNRIMKDLLKDQQSTPPVRPAGVVGAQVCNIGTQATPNPDGTPGSCPTHFEYVIRGTERLNTGISTKREQVWVTKDSDKLSKEGAENVELKEKTILSDGFGRSCLDCAGDQPQPSPTKTP